MNIRQFIPSDTQGVIALWRECFQYPAPHNDPEESLKRKRELDDGLFFVAADSRVPALIAGTVLAGWDGHRGWIYSLAVDGRYRRRGIGRMLIEHAVDALEQRNCPKVNLQVMPGNHKVIGFYEKLGFCREERVSMGRKLY